MTEAHLVAKKLALIETYLRDLRQEGRPELITKDLRELRFTEQRYHHMLAAKDTTFRSGFKLGSGPAG